VFPPQGARIEQTAGPAKQVPLVLKLQGGRTVSLACQRKAAARHLTRPATTMATGWAEICHPDGHQRDRAGRAYAYPGGAERVAL